MSNKLIEVGFKKQVQPVRIAGMDFEIKLGEKYKKQYFEVIPKMETELQKIREGINEASQKSDYKALNAETEKAKQVIKDAIDLLFGEGSFDKLYEAADDDIEVVTEAFLEVMEQYKALQTKKKAKAYIDGKK